MYVGIILVICQGWLLFRLGGANECVGTSISNVFGEISYIPLGSKLRVPKDCVWTIEPPREQDFLLIIKLNYLYSYENDDDLILPDRSSLPRQSIEHGEEPLCSKYVLSALQSKPCLETLGKLYCPETQIKTTRKPIRIAISTLPRFQKSAATYFYTNFQASYLFVFCNDTDTQPQATLPTGEGGIEVQFEEESSGGSNSAVATTIVFVIFLIIAIVVIILLLLKIRHDKMNSPSEMNIKPVERPVVESKRYPTPSQPQEDGAFRKQERDVLWMDLLALESHSDPACNETSKAETSKAVASKAVPPKVSPKVGCEDPPCNDELLNHPKSHRAQPTHQSRPSTPHHAHSYGSLELPATFANYAGEESAGLRVSENNSYVTTVDRRELRQTASNSSSQTLNSDVHPTYTMRTLNIIYNRPSRSEIVFDETCHEIHTALESICNSDDMETASMIASTILGEEKGDVNFGRRGFCKAGSNFDKITGSVMCLTVFLVMCLMQISKRLEGVGHNDKPALDPMRIFKQIQASKARTQQCTSSTRMCDVVNAKAPQGRIQSAKRGEESDAPPVKPKPPRDREEGRGGREQEKMGSSSHEESYSESTRASTYQGSETDKNSEPATSVTSEPVSEDQVTRSQVKGIMKKPAKRKQTGVARRRSSLARFLERTSWGNVFSNKRVDVDKGGR